MRPPSHSHLSVRCAPQFSSAGARPQSPTHWQNRFHNSFPPPYGGCKTCRHTCRLRRSTCKVASAFSSRPAAAGSHAQCSQARVLLAGSVQTEPDVEGTGERTGASAAGQLRRAPGLGRFQGLLPVWGVAPPRWRAQAVQHETGGKTFGPAAMISPLTLQPRPPFHSTLDLPALVPCASVSPRPHTQPWAYPATHLAALRPAASPLCSLRSLPDPFRWSSRRRRRRGPPLGRAESPRRPCLPRRQAGLPARASSAAATLWAKDCST